MSEQTKWDAVGPELLAALRQCAASLTVQTETARILADAGRDPIHNSGRATELQTLADYARAAIAKAEGRA